MKRPRIPAGPTNKFWFRIKRVAGSCEGSLLLEAALVMPVFLLFLVFLVAFVQFSAAETALQTAADGTVRQAATHIRPALLLQQEAASQGDSSEPAEPSKPVSTPLPAWRETAAEVTGLLPEPAGPLAEAVLKGDWEALRDMALEPIGRAVFEPLLRQAAQETPLKPERVRLAGLTLPDLSGGKEAFLVLEAEYEFPIRVPFSGKPIILHRTAAERVWIPDPLPAAGSDGEQEELGTVRITGLSPVPARPGRRATLTAQASPGVEVTLEVRYKSGSSVSRNVGKKKADASGAVEWTWLISGNTTPGVWEVIVTSSDGGKDSMPFTVQKSTGQATPAP